MDLEALLTSLGPFGFGLLSAASPCLLPLYPGFIAYLGANATALQGRRATGLLGLLVLAGVLSTMTAIGIGLSVIGVTTGRLLAYATPVVDGLIIVLGVLLLAGRNPFARFPSLRVPVLANPFGQAYVYGLLLGPIALPCAGPFLVSLLGISIGVTDALGKIWTFLLFGLGFGLPLVLLSLLAVARGQTIVRWIVERHRAIEIVAGAVLIVVAIVDLVDKWDLIVLTLGS
jgi:cytochrome c-type biogenesis protein